MEEVSSSTDISSSLSEFIRKERILKELYQENKTCVKPAEVHLNRNDKEIDSILQQMGRLLSPAGEELDNKVYKHVIAETENKSIEQILNEAKELINENVTVGENESIYISNDDLSSECLDKEINSLDVRNIYNSNNVNGKEENASSSDEELQIQLETNKTLKKETSRNEKKKNLRTKKEVNNSPKKINTNKNKLLSKDHKLYEKMNYFRNEFFRIKSIYDLSKQENENLTENIQKLKQQEKQLLEENQRLSQNVVPTITQEEYDILQSKLITANETIHELKSNFTKATEEWKKKEIKLIDERNQSKYKLQNVQKIIPADVELLREKLKDEQEMNVKLKFDLDSYKDKCTALENLSVDLKKIIMDEQIVERVYANDKIPISVKQFLSSSSSSVINTITHMFGCLSRNASKNRYNYSGQKDYLMRNDLFTTNESSMINDVNKSFEHSDLIRELIKEKEQIKNENLDLNRQVKELEKIVRRRAHSNFSNVSEIIRNVEPKLYEKESETVKNLKKELLEKQRVIIDLKNQLVEAKVGYDKNLLALQEKLVSIQEESSKLKEELDKKKVTTTLYATKCKRKGRSCDPPPSSIRNIRVELTSREKEIQQLTKQLDEIKKINKKLLKDKENYYLSFKEQSADDIRISKKYLPTMNNEEREKSVHMKNTTSEILMESKDVKPNMQLINSNQVNQDFENKHVNNDKQMLNSLEIHADSETRLIKNDLKNINDYEKLSEKLNFLESKHQNLQQITCDLLKILSKGELGEKLFQNQMTDNKSVEHQDELSRFVTALKHYSK